MRLVRIINIALLSLLIVVLSGCSKEDGFDCFKSTGDLKLEERFVSPYRYIEVRDNINLVLTQDTLVNSLQVEAGENLLPGIITEVENGRLYLRNENSCNWVRKFDAPINVYISFSRMDTIVYRAAGDLTFTTPWKSDSIQFDVWEGAGMIDLKLEVYQSKVYVHYGVVTLKLSGQSQVTYISNKGYGPVDALDLYSNFTFMRTVSPNDCYIMAESEIGATIDNIGNVYYTGDPEVINKELNSSGRLIRME